MLLAMRSGDRSHSGTGLDPRASRHRCARRFRPQREDQGQPAPRNVTAHHQSNGASPHQGVRAAAWTKHGEASEVAIRAQDKPLRALLYAGRPLHEAVVARGPLVMNTEAEIEQAYADYRAGRFGSL